MSRVFITGDCHGEFHKFNSKRFPQGKELDRQDYVFICGDFGGVWDGSRADRYWLDWLEEKPWTTIVIGGNHENYELIERAYPITDALVGDKWIKCRRFRDNILWIERGTVLTINGCTFWCFGGAESTDKEYRQYHIDWWEREMPSMAEYNHGLDTLEELGNEVDFIVTHDCPSAINLVLYDDWRNHPRYKANSLNTYFDEVRKTVKYDKWFFGHHHDDRMLPFDCFLFYNWIAELDFEV